MEGWQEDVANPWQRGSRRTLGGLAMQDQRMRDDTSTTSLTGAHDETAARLIDARHRIFQGFLVRTGHRVRGYTTRHFELLPGT